MMTLSILLEFGIWKLMVSIWYYLAAGECPPVSQNTFPSLDTSGVSVANKVWAFTLFPSIKSLPLSSNLISCYLECVSYSKFGWKNFACCSQYDCPEIISLDWISTNVVHQDRLSFMISATAETPLQLPTSIFLISWLVFRQRSLLDWAQKCSQMIWDF